MNQRTCSWNRAFFLAVAVAGFGAQAGAAVRNWTAGSGNWGNGTNWNSPFTPPTANDTAAVTFTDATKRAVTLDVNGVFSTLDVGNGGGGGLLLSQLSSFNLTGNGEILGFGGGANHNQRTVVNTFNQFLVIGQAAGKSSTYSLGGSGTIHVVANPGNNFQGEIIGQTGTGTLTQTGGTHTNDGSLTMGINSGSSAIYTQSGGTATIGTSTSVQAMNIASGTSSTGSYTISGSAIMLVHGSIYVGGSAPAGGGTGTLTMNGGSLTASSIAVYSHGTLNFNAGTLSVPTITNSGLLSGHGTTTAAVSVFTGGNVSPGGSGVGTLTLGGLMTNSGSILTFDPGDQLTITNSNGLNLAASTTLAFPNAVDGIYPLINYSGAISGSIGNLVGPASSAQETYSIVNNAAVHQVQLVANRIGTQQALAIRNQAAPGGGTFLGFGEDSDSEHAVNETVVSLNNAGEVAFRAGVSGAADGASQGIFLWNGSSLQSVARANQGAPDGGSYTAFAFKPVMDASGFVAFSGNLTGSSDGANQGLFLSDGTTATTLARSNHLANGGGLFGGETLGGVNSGGQAVFYSTLTGNPADQAANGVFSSFGFSVARAKGAEPGGGTFTDFQSALPSINESGQFSILGTITGAADGATQGIFFRASAGASLVSIARQNQSASGNGTFGSISSVSKLNSSGQVAFGAQINGATDGAVAGVFRGDSSSAPIALARSNSSFPNGASVSSFGNTVMNDAGQVAFEAYGSSELGIYRAAAGASLATIVQKNQLAPDGEFYTDFTNPAINSGGTVAFWGELSSTPGGAPIKDAIVLSNGMSSVMVIKLGQPLAGTTISDVAPEFSINDLGQVAYTVLLADGRSGNFLFTPAIHWVAGGSGNWDTSTNWTAGITPASIHDVFLDPATAQTVIGPTGNVTVNSLSIGGNGGAVALNITTGNVSVLNSLNVAADGSSLNLSKATISLPAFTNIGVMNISGFATFAGSVTNNGTFTVGGVQNWAQESTFTNTAGSANFQSDPGSSSSLPLAINAAGGTVTFSSTQHLAGLSISGGATVIQTNAPGSRVEPVLVTSSLSFDGTADGWQGLLDLTQYDMVVKNGVAGDIASQLKAGFNAGSGYWNGSAGIVSSTAASNTRFLTTLGTGAGGSVFDGVTTTAADVLVKYTYYGDADLNGTVNGADYQQIDMGFGTGATVWSKGDFNYDGVVNGSDFALIDNTFNQITAMGASALAILSSTTAIQPDVTDSVPEPISFASIAIATAALVVAPRRKSKPFTQ